MLSVEPVSSNGKENPCQGCLHGRMAVPIEGGTMSILVLSRRGSDLLYLPHQFDSALVTSAKGSSHSCIRVVGNPGVGIFSLALTTPYRYRWLVTLLPWLWRKHSSGPLGNSTLLLRSCGMYHLFLRWSSYGGKLVLSDRPGTSTDCTMMTGIVSFHPFG